MKKAICALALTTLFCGAAFAANGSYTVSAALSPDITVNIDGVDRTFYNVQGQEVHPISYAGTTYVPIRSIGELMDKNVNWDSTTNTATIGGARTTPDATGTPDANARPMDITLSMEPNYTIIIDGVKRTFYDVNGKVCDPALYNGSIYLPIRAIGEIMGKNVSWNGATSTVYLSGNTQDGGVTDYDTSNPSGNQGGSMSGASITVEQARQAALDHAGLTASQVTFIRSYLDYDDGRRVYDVEFIVSNGSGYTEYDYEIDANTGLVLSYDRDAEYYRPSTGGNQSGSMSGASITVEQARQAALDHAGLTASQVTFIRSYLDYDDGRRVYDVEFIVSNGSGYTEYDYEIDANTGLVLSYDRDAEYYRPSTGGNQGGSTNTSISLERAREIALQRVPGASASNVYELHLDRDDGRLEYEGKIIYNAMEYDFTIDANTGNIIDWEAESIYD